MRPGNVHSADGWRDLLEPIIDRYKAVGKRIYFRADAGELFPRVGFIATNLSARAEKVVRFYNQRGNCEQWIKEGKYALSWTRPCCCRFVSNQVRLSLFVLAYDLGNFLRRFALPGEVSHWSLRSVQLKLIKIGARIISHARRTVIQMAEVAVPGELFAEVLARIRSLALAPT